MGGDLEIIDQEKDQIAIEIAVRAGTLAWCDAHETPLHKDDGVLEDAYRLANYLVSAGDPLVAAFEGNRRELTDRIKLMVESQGPDCAGCAAAQRR